MLTVTSAGKFFVEVPPPDLVGATVASKRAIGAASFVLDLSLSSTLLYPGFGQHLDALGVTPSQQAKVVGWFSTGDVPAWAEGTDLVHQVVAAQDSYVHAYRTTMLTFAVIVIVMVVVTRRTPEGRHHTGSAAAAMPDA